MATLYRNYPHISCCPIFNNTLKVATRVFYHADEFLKIIHKKPKYNRMDKPFKFALPSPNFNKNAKDACKPKPHFLTPSGMSLLPREKQPPPMYGKHGSTVPPRYLQTNATGLAKPDVEEPDKQYCEPCELELQSLEDLKRHRAQHEKCPVAGCLYKGHPSVMDKHVNALHASGLFDKFKKLSTPEEIAAWREERKKRYPTLANVLLKEKAQEQRQKRGERLDANKNRFGKVNDKKRAQRNTNEAKAGRDESAPKEGKPQNLRNKRNRKNKRNQKSREHKDKTEVKKEVKHSEAKNEGPAEICCGGVKMFKGTSKMKDYKHLKDKKKEPIINNALFGLIGMYGSDDDSDENDNEDECRDEVKNNDVASISESHVSIAVNMEESCSTDIKEFDENIKTDPTEISSKNTGENSVSIDKEIRENKSEDKNKDELKHLNPSPNSSGKNINENNTISPALVEPTKENSVDDNVVNTPAAVTENSSDEAPEETPIQRSIPDYPIKPDKNPSSLTNEEPLAKKSKQDEQISKRKLAKRKSGLDYRKARVRKQNTMLEKLLETDIRHERNVLLQCVRYVCENNYFGIGQSNQTKPD